MKKSFTVNIGGKIYHIDEDAYNLLNDYFNQLRTSFPGEEGAEITADIECRVHEILAADCGSNSESIVTIEQVHHIIDRVGSPEQIGGCSSEDEAEPEEKAKEKVCPPPFEVKRKLFRSSTSKVFGGVLGGIATYFGWNAVILRLLFVILVLCTYVWPFVILYLVAWMVIPEAVTARQKLEQQGQPVSIYNVGREVRDMAGGSSGSAVTMFFEALGKGILFFIGLIAFSITLGCFVVFIYSLLAGIVVSATSVEVTNRCLAMNLPDNFSSLYLYLASALSLLAAIPAGCMAWFCCRPIIGAPKMPGWMTTTAIVLECVAAIAAVVCIIVIFNTDASLIPVAINTSIPLILR